MGREVGCRRIFAEMICFFLAEMPSRLDDKFDDDENLVNTGQNEMESSLDRVFDDIDTGLIGTLLIVIQVFSIILCCK